MKVVSKMVKDMGMELNLNFLFSMIKTLKLKEKYFFHFKIRNSSQMMENYLKENG